MKTLLFFALCLFSVATATAQPPTIEIEAKTYDGKVVILKSDGTWRYKDGAASASGVGTLAVEAALVFQNRDVRPLARTTFYVSKRSLKEIVEEPSSVALFREQLRVKGGSFANDPAGPFIFVAFPELYSLYAPPILTKLKAEVIESPITDFNGKFELNNLANGSYFLVGITKTPRGAAVWDLPFSINNSRTVITVDQNNAVFIF